jgi:glycosyltransferase involved in cell wall biosynthesis
MLDRMEQKPAAQPGEHPNPKKKVLFLITKSNWGGAQRYVYDLATHLDPERFTPVVALGGTGVLKEQLEHAGVRVITISSLDRDISLRKEWAFATELWQILRTEQPAVFHVNSSKAGGIGTLLGRLARVPRVIFTAHGWAFNETRPLWQRLVIKALHWVTVLLSHKTIAVSNAIVTQMNWPGALRKFKIIHPGRTIGAMYDRTEARMQLTEIHSPLHSYRDDPWVLTIAELHPIKQLPTLIEAMQRTVDEYPQLRSIIIGEGEERLHLERLITETGLQNHVFLTGTITEAARFLKAADLFVLPSRSESYGYVLHEAGLAGVPVIASDVGGIRDIVTDGVSGRLLPVGGTKQLAAALAHFAAHPEDWTPFAHQLHAHLRSRTVAHMATQTEAVYELPL